MNDPFAAGRTTEPVSLQVIMAVARVEDVDPADLPPLYDAIDPDALNMLFPANGAEPGPSDRKLRFTYADRDVVVRDGGEIDVRASEDPDPSERGG